MIKEYFTDGLIGLAILLSLFRTDLDIVNINNLFSYPEVQDIIQGQTAVYLPANFHHIRNTPHAFGNAKHVDFDTEALTAWYNNFNINNLPNFRGIRRNDIEAFLVSGTTAIGPHMQDVSTSNSVATESDGPPLASSPTLPEEGAYSFPELTVTVSNNASSESQDQVTSSLTNAEEAPVVVDVSFLFNNPFPGCNLTSEDLELIDVLWRQDEDLGVGKEVYDTNLRLEMEKKQELEQVRLQEMHKAQLLAKEKEEREKQEQADRWLKENFRRDGETGEWVCLQNTAGCTSSVNPVLPQADSGNEDFPETLDSALDYIFNASSELLAQNTVNVQQEQTVLMPNTAGNIQLEEYLPIQQLQQQPTIAQPTAQAAPHAIQHQDSLDVDDWAGLADYLNMNGSSIVEETLVTSANDTDNCPDFLLVDDASGNCNSLATNVSGVVVNPGSSSNVSMYEPISTNSSTSVSMYEPISPGVADTQRSAYVLNNVSMPADGVNMTAELMSLTSASEMSASEVQNMSESQAPLSNLSNAAVNFDLDQLNFFDELAGLEGVESPQEDLGLAEIDEMFRSIQSSGSALLEPILDIGQSMDTLQRLGEEMNQTMVSVGSSSSHEDFDNLEGLEGAIGGSVDNFTTSFNQGSSSSSGGSDFNSLKGPGAGRQKVQRFSESSNDSGYAHKGSFSSSNSTNGSSYSGSPAGSAHGLAESGSSSSSNNHSYINNFHHHHQHHHHHGGSTTNGNGVMVLNSNGTTSGNGTEHDPHGVRTATLAQHQVAHNHTYNTPPGQVPREVKKYAHKEPSRKGPQSRDQRRANELKVPFTLDEIIESPVETFNEMINAHKLSEPQLNLIRDIRRRGKNKVAAQNCRKRKVSAIVSLSDERSDLEIARDNLLAERAKLEVETRRMRTNFGQLYAHIFQSLRDEDGQPYDPSMYSLQQSDDGNVFLVPRNVTAAVGAAGGVVSSSPTAVNGSSMAVVVPRGGGGGGSAGSSSAASSVSSSPSARASSSLSSTSSSKGSVSGSKKRKSFDE